MPTEKMMVAPKGRTRSEVQQLVAEFMSKRHAAERVLPESSFELQHAGSPPKETALEEKA
jgi:hypothetical protein